MQEKAKETNTFTVLANGMLYLSILVIIASISVFGFEGYLNNAILVYSSQLLLLLSTMIPFLPRDNESFNRLFNRSAGGLLIFSLLSALELIYYSRLKTSTLLASLGMVALFGFSSYKAVLIGQKRAYGREMLDLLGAGLTAFGAVLQAFASRFSVQQANTIGFFGIPLVILGLAMLFYSRFMLKR